MPAYSTMSVKELKLLCKEMKLTKYSRMKKQQLIDLLIVNFNGILVKKPLLDSPALRIKKLREFVGQNQKMKSSHGCPDVFCPYNADYCHEIYMMYPNYDGKLLTNLQINNIQSNTSKLNRQTPEPTPEVMKQRILKKLDVCERVITKEEERVLANTINLDSLSDYSSYEEEMEERIEIVNAINFEETKDAIDEVFKNKIQKNDTVEIEWEDNVMEDLDNFIQTYPDKTSPPLPINLRTSPITPIRSLKELEVCSFSYKRYKTSPQVAILRKMKVKELKAVCKDLKIKGYSKLKKADILALIMNI